MKRHYVIPAQSLVSEIISSKCSNTWIWNYGFTLFRPAAHINIRYITLQTPPVVGGVPVQLHVGRAAERGQQDQHRTQQQLRRGRRTALQQHQHQAQQPQGA